jgi:hypothetical protein
MSREKTESRKTLLEKYFPSEPCSCEICLGYCARPGWWTVEQAAAIEAGFDNRIMLEIAPELTFGVLSGIQRMRAVHCRQSICQK